MCDEYREDGFLSWQCIHGLGPGAMFYTVNDRPRSLEMCDVLENFFASSNCANWVFMETFNTGQKLHLSTFLKVEDPFYLCMEQSEHHKVDCYMYAPTYSLSLHEDDYAAPRSGARVRRRSVCRWPAPKMWGRT